MNLPYEVQKQADEADRIEKQLAGELEEAPQQSDGETWTTEEQNAGNIGNDRDLNSELERANARYKSLEGMYRADGNRYRAQLGEMNQRLAEQSRKLEELQREKEIANRKTFVSEEDIETFGQDMADFVQRAARDVVQEASLRDTRDAEIDALRSKVNQMEQYRAEQQASDFYRRLANELPDWEAQNKDQGFLQWLTQRDPFSGDSRQELLNRAVMKGDVQACAWIFKEYRKAVSQNQASQSNSLARQVAPTHTRSAPRDTGDNPSQKIWTDADIAEYYRRWRHGEISQSESERIEQELDRAAAEGRIRPY